MAKHRKARIPDYADAETYSVTDLDKEDFPDAAGAEPAKAEPEKTEPVRNRKRLLVIPAILLLSVGGFFGYWYYERCQIWQTCSVEAGVAVTAADFVKQENAEVSFTEESDAIDITVPGEYRLVVRKGLFEHPCTLKIVDTIPPEVEVRDLVLENGETCTPEDFIVGIRDATVTEISFGKEPDYSDFEPQTVEILVTDAGGNTTSALAELSITCVVDTLTWEAGAAAPVISDFVIAGTGGRIVTDLGRIDFNVPGSHEVEVELNDKRYSVQLKVADTTPPVLVVKDVEGLANCKRSVEEFVVETEDVTAVTVVFQTPPDVTLLGTQSVTVVATDEGGNQTLQEAALTLTADTEAPVITGVRDMRAYLGEGVSYRTKVKVTDSCAETVLKVDSSQVNLNAVGSYPVTYTATDCSGNVTSITVTLTVRERVYTLEEINQLADGILAGILTEGMTQYDKAYAIFNYVKGSISYINSSEKGNYLRAAYEGMVDKKGDCYVYASTAKALLDRAGVVNMDIERIPSGTAMHYWNLVDIGDGNGWYHFDTTPRKDHPVIFLWNDQQIKEYSDRHNNCHNYDRTLYPVIN